MTGLLLDPGPAEHEHTPRRVHHRDLESITRLFVAPEPGALDLDKDFALLLAELDRHAARVRDS